MLPDYPHKIFNDKRSNYSLLMETLAMNPQPLREANELVAVLTFAQYCSKRRRVRRNRS
jgi:hypothetical protein